MPLLAASPGVGPDFFFDQLDALAAETSPLGVSASQLRPTGSPSLSARRSLPVLRSSPPRPTPASPVLSVATVVDEVPNGVLYDVPLVVLDLDGRPMAHSLPASVAANAALRAFLASCSRPLPPALLPPPARLYLRLRLPGPWGWCPSAASGLRPRSRLPARATRSLARSAT